MDSNLRSYPRLLGDVGGTHARFATVRSAGAGITDVSTHACADFDGIESLLEHRLARFPAERPRACALGMALPIAGDRVRMTNLGWSFSIDRLKTHLGLDRLLVLNDFAALALAMPTLKGDDALAIGEVEEGPPLASKAVLGPGTGLGVAGLVHVGGAWRPVAGEGGHVSLAAHDELEDEVLRVLRPRLGHVSAERILSGPGLVNLHAALLAIRGAAPVPAADAAFITGRALERSDDACVATVNCFLGWLAAVAGDLALVFGALGGVYVGGGIVPRLVGVLDPVAFRGRFEAKGRYEEYLRRVPTRIVADASQAALTGADHALDLPP